MRFRKVRSFLSAYCNGELKGKEQKAIRERLAEDASLRDEEQALRLLREAVKKAPSEKISDDFNTRLLNRIANERFAETRSRAMLPPRRVPLPLWTKVVPAVVTATVILVFGVTSMFDSGDATRQFASRGGLDDSYLTAQPDGNPNVTVAVSENWTLERAMRQSQRVSRIYNQLTSVPGFMTTGHAGGNQRVLVRHPARSPFVAHYYQVVPVQTVYQVHNGRRTNSTY